MMKKELKRTLSAILLGAVTLTLAACGSSSSDGAASDTPAARTGSGTDGSVVTIAAPADPGNYLPFNADNTVRNTYSGFFYEQLFNMHDTSEGLEPELATGYERVEEGKYLVTLNENIYDSNGEHITADDVAFCFNTTIANGERKASIGELQSVDVVDEYTVQLNLEPDLLGVFETCVISQDIVSQKSYEASETGFSSDPVGTGPYVISEWLPGSSMTLVKNENYWAKDLYDNQRCDEIVIKYISEPSQAAIELETGNVDWAYNLTTEDADKFAETPGYEVYNALSAQVRSIGFNCDESNVFSDVRLRQAVAYAIDAEAILQGAYKGKGGVATCLAVPEPEAGLVLDYDSAWDDDVVYEYNPEKAKELLAEAGYPNGGLKVRLMTKDDAEYRTTAEIIQAYLLQVGIEVEILSYENALYQTYRFQPDMFDMYICQVANNSNPYLPAGWKWYLNRDASTGKSVLFTDDDKLQELLNTALGIETHNQETVDELQQYILDQCYLYPYCYTYTSYGYVDTIEDPYVVNGIVFCPNLSTYAGDAAADNSDAAAGDSDAAVNESDAAAE